MFNNCRTYSNIRFQGKLVREDLERVVTDFFEGRFFSVTMDRPGILDAHRDQMSLTFVQADKNCGFLLDYPGHLDQSHVGRLARLVPLDPVYVEHTTKFFRHFFEDLPPTKEV